MRKTIASLCLFLLTLGCFAVCGAQDSPPKKLKLIFGDQQAVVMLEDHPAVRDFVSLLPQTISFEDYNGIEKIGYLPKKLQTQGSPSSCDPTGGTFAYYAPWGNLSIFYLDFRHSENLVPLGRVESGLDNLARMQGNFSIRLELVE